MSVSLWLRLAETLQSFFNILLVFRSLVLSQEVCNYWFQWLAGRQFSFSQCFVKHWVLHEFSYLRDVKYSSLDFFHSYQWQLLLKEIKPAAIPSSLPSQSSSLLLSWYLRMEAVFSSVQRERETERYVSQILTLVLLATLVWHNVGLLPGCLTDTENKITLCTYLGTPGPVQPS